MTTLYKAKICLRINKLVLKVVGFFIHTFYLGSQHIATKPTTQTISLVLHKLQIQKMRKLPKQKLHKYFNTQ